MPLLTHGIGNPLFKPADLGSQSERESQKIYILTQGKRFVRSNRVTSAERLARCQHGNVDVAGTMPNQLNGQAFPSTIVPYLNLASPFDAKG